MVLRRRRLAAVVAADAVASAGRYVDRTAKRGRTYFSKVQLVGLRGGSAWAGLARIG